MNLVVLENEKLKATFDPSNGALLNLVSRRTGWEIQGRSELGLSFKMLVPLPERHYNHVHGETQKPVSVDVADNGLSVTFAWDGLDSEHTAGLDIGLRIEVSLDELGLAYNCEVDNRSEYVIECINVPQFGDLRQTQPDEQLYTRRYNYSGMNVSPLLPEFANDYTGYWGVNYPTQMHSVSFAWWMLIGSTSQGIYVGRHHPRGDKLVTFAYQLKPGFDKPFHLDHGLASPEAEIDAQPNRLEFSVWHHGMVQPGETYTLSPIVIQPYQGTWHKGVDLFLKWRETWYSKPRVANWTEDVHSWMQLQINGAEDTLWFQYKDLVKYARQCAKWGVKAIQLTGWAYGGQDHGNPSHSTDDRLGSWQDLKQAIEDCRKLGVEIILFSKFVWADRTTEFYPEWEKHTVKDPYGKPYIQPGYSYYTETQLAGINRRDFSPLCHLSSK